MNSEQNKVNAIAFYDLMLNQCKSIEAINKYVGDFYKPQSLCSRWKASLH
jgi:predicted SnoaL-like aldol condensation-catalyzing enzyme